MAVDVATKRAVSLEVSAEQTHDSEKLKPLVREARRKVRMRKALGEGSYDTHDNFTFLAGQGIEAGIKVRDNSSGQCEGPRGEVVGEYLADPLGWKRRVGYGRRWMAETFFSGFKRLFGEVVYARRWERMVGELRLKAWVYNLLIGLGLTPTPGT